MNQKEKAELSDLYEKMTNKKLKEMLLVDKNEYNEGVYELLLSEVSKRGQIFYRKAVRILFILWIVISIFFSLVLKNYAVVFSPIFAAIICALIFVNYFFIRSIWHVSFKNR